MQQAYKPAKAITTQESLLIETGHTAVLFSPERLNLTEKQVGVMFVEARHFVILRDQTLRVLDQSENRFGGGSTEEGPKTPVQNYTKPAHACGQEILISFEQRGATVIFAFNDVSAAKVQLLEDKLNRLGWFDVPTLEDLLDILGRVAISDEIEGRAVEELTISINTAIAYRQSRFDDTVTELEGKRAGQMGRAKMTEVEKTYYAEAGLVVPDTVNQVVPEPVDEAELTRRVAEAVVKPMSDAMNNFAEALTKKLEQGGQANGSEENGKEVGAKVGKAAAGKERVAA